MAWAVYDAKARFSELLDATLRDGPQIVSRRGVETAVFVPIEEWRRLNQKVRNSMPDPLLDPGAPRDIPLPVRRPVLKLRPFRFDDEKSS